ncbi:hypothetical protein [Pedobacter sp. N23S346]|uniref:hypothetical protein n=1 Tax=Pedobacter sp. N23S346 TaxID=3402750 RepID=UPI003AD683EB
MEDGKWKMDNGKWIRIAKNERQKTGTGNGKRELEDGKWNWEMDQEKMKNE